MLDKKSTQRIKDYVINTGKKIKVKSGRCRYNFRCQMNAVNDALSSNQPTLGMCVCINNDSCFIHFINISKNNTFIDNTLGQWSIKYDYYLIKIIDKKDFFNINNIFTNFRKELHQKLPIYLRMVNTVEF